MVDDIQHVASAGMLGQLGCDQVPGLASPIQSDAND